MGQKRIAIYVGTFYTAQMDSANLGGSEVAALNLATELIKLGKSDNTPVRLIIPETTIGKQLEAFLKEATTPEKIQMNLRLYQKYNNILKKDKTIINTDTNKKIMTDMASTIKKDISETLDKYIELKNIIAGKMPTQPDNDNPAIKLRISEFEETKKKKQ